MKYIITEQQYRLLTEDKILRLPFDAFNNDWWLLQRFLEKRGNPPYEITGNLDLQGRMIKSLGNLVSVKGYLDLGYTRIESLGDLKYVGGKMSLYDTKIESLGDLKYVGGDLHLAYSPLSKTTTEDEIRNKVEVEGIISFR